MILCANYKKLLKWRIQHNSVNINCFNGCIDLKTFLFLYLFVCVSVSMSVTKFLNVKNVAQINVHVKAHIFRTTQGNDDPDLLYTTH